MLSPGSGGAEGTSCELLLSLDILNFFTGDKQFIKQKEQFKAEFHFEYELQLCFIWTIEVLITSKNMSRFQVKKLTLYSMIFFNCGLRFLMRIEQCLLTFLWMLLHLLNEVVQIFFYFQYGERAINCMICENLFDLILYSLEDFYI